MAEDAANKPAAFAAVGEAVGKSCGVTEDLSKVQAVIVLRWTSDFESRGGQRSLVRAPICLSAAELLGGCG
jgi:hypothetical protein